ALRHQANGRASLISGPMAIGLCHSNARRLTGGSATLTFPAGDANTRGPAGTRRRRRAFAFIRTLSAAPLARSLHYPFHVTISSGPLPRPTLDASGTCDSLRSITSSRSTKKLQSLALRAPRRAGVGGILIAAGVLATHKSPAPVATQVP